MYTLQTPKKQNPFVLILAIIGGFALLLFACVFFSGFIGSSAQSSSYEVVYRIAVPRCTEFGVTYSMPDGTSQRDITACPGNGVVDGFYGAYGDFVYLSAQNQGHSSNGTGFTCVIEVNGKVIANVQSAGFANIASCSSSIQ